jgi:hypothetical protein
MLAAKQTANGIRLCQLRNPWGGFEWQGDWSDSSDLWTVEIKEELNVVLADDDGTFWMCFDDLLKHFFSINVCMADSSANNNISWTEKRRKICFTFGADGNISTPMYIFSNKQTSKVYFSLHQEDQRCENALPYLDIGVSILQILPDYTCVGARAERARGARGAKGASEGSEGSARQRDDGVLLRRKGTGARERRESASERSATKGLPAAAEGGRRARAKRARRRGFILRRKGASRKVGGVGGGASNEESARCGGNGPQEGLDREQRIKGQKGCRLETPRPTPPA